MDSRRGYKSTVSSSLSSATSIHIRIWRHSEIIVLCELEMNKLGSFIGCGLVGLFSFLNVSVVML